MQTVLPQQEKHHVTMDPSKKNMNIASLNCEGFNRSENYILEFLEGNCDIMLLQETWLLESSSDKLTSCHPRYLAIAKSGVDETAAILSGRPHGGVAILFKKNLANFIEPISTESKRMCCAILNHVSGFRTLIMSVYLPCDSFSATRIDDEYEQCINEIELIMNAHNFDECIIGGDFNTSFERNNCHTLNA